MSNHVPSLTVDGTAKEPAVSTVVPGDDSRRAAPTTTTTTTVTHGGQR
jgi:hypothetical protein